jgi:hypothetical protein
LQVDRDEIGLKVAGRSVSTVGGVMPVKVPVVAPVGRATRIPVFASPSPVRSMMASAALMIAPVLPAAVN